VSDDLDLAARVVREAGQLAARMREAGVTASRKTSASDLVTAADRAAEELIVELLRAERPEDGIVGEEGTADPRTRTWFVDPIDGTYNFVCGLPLWCSAAALTDADGLVLGAVYHPATDELWLGGRDRRTTRNGVTVVTPADRPLPEVSLATYLHPITLPDAGLRTPLLSALARAATVRMLGSGSIELAYVAAGRLGAWMQADSLDWDWLPGAALVTAAGGAAQVVHAGAHRWHLAGSDRAVAELAALLSR
jgi:myo-inositol-1(or 4)-monophosphatase